MLHAITDFINSWGYLAVMIGSMIEGESVILTASALSAAGYMSIYKVFFIAFITTVITDQILFFIGYKVGTKWLMTKFPKLKKTKDKVFNLLHKMDIFFIFAFRFIYGIRTISPLIIGSSRINPKRFIVYNFFSGLCWAFISCFLGYVVTDYVMEQELNTLPATLIVTTVIIAFMSIIAFVFKVKEKKINKEK